MTIRPDVGDSAVGRIEILDGWRALSILLVLAGHWAPLGPRPWGLNHAVPAAGMALFFTLSGLLIAQLLLRDPRVVPFLIRRFFRILPLAWTAMLILIIATQADTVTAAKNLSFLANLPPARLMTGGHHLWSLCVEIQFYLFAALIVMAAGKRGLYILPLVMVLVTALRIADHQPISIVTWHRVDEILAGSTLALLLVHFPPAQFARRIPAWAPLLCALGLLAASHPGMGPLCYARPYFAAATIGSSLYAVPQWLRTVLCSAPARYIAEVSFAVYVVHGMLTATWLGGENASTIQRYLRRPLLVIATFALAHLSTRHFESRWIALGKRLCKKYDRRHSNLAGSTPVADRAS
ncbi:MAG: acyltransferase [Proteobacteria bacterium]|nr:acyltransferase [Pseudomonadota bacterium]